MIVFLAKPYEFNIPYVDQEERIRLWGRKVRGFALKVGANIDEACLDNSRMFYLPRHREGGEYEVHLIGGEFLDLDTVQEVDRGERVDTSDPFAVAGAEMAPARRSDVFRFTPNGVDLFEWGRNRADGFEIAQAIQFHAAERVRTTSSDGSKLEIMCPFDDDHSNAGDDTDTACMVEDASARDGHGFAFGCRHNSCSGYGKLDFLCKAIREEYLPESILHDPDYDCLDREAEAAAEPEQRTGEERISHAIADLTPGSSVSDISRVIDIIASEAPDALTQADALDSLQRQTNRQKQALNKEFRKAEARRKSFRREMQEASGRPLINPLQNFKEAVRRTQELLAQAHVEGRHPDVPSPYIFQAGGGLVRLRRDMDADGALTAEPMQPAMMMEAAMEVARFSTSDDGDSEQAPSGDLCRLLLAAREQPFHHLRGLTTTPFFDSDFNLVDSPGYHVPSGQFYDPTGGLVIPSVKQSPSSEEARASVAWLIDEVFGDFPFDGKDNGSASKATVMALLLQFFMLHGFDGNPTPIYLISKAEPGTGAGLLTDVICRIATGLPAAAATESSSEEERRKTIASVIMSGATYYFLDNINREVDSSAIASAVTSGRLSARRLGTNDQITLKMNLIFIFAGNNIEMSHEMARRCVYCRLIKKVQVDEPKFKHPKLPEFVMENRGLAIHHCLTIIQHWVSIGRPLWTGKALASFESYSAVMGGILQAAGVEGFLANREELQDSANSGNEQIGDFVRAWFEASGVKARPIGNPDDIQGEWGGSHSLVSIYEGAGLTVPLKHGQDISSKPGTLARILKSLDGRLFNLDDRVVRVVAMKEVHSKTRSKMYGLEEVAA